MENLRRKELDTSATISIEGGFAVRTTLHPPLVAEDVMCLERLFAWLSDILYSHRHHLISAPPDRWE